MRLSNPLLIVPILIGTLLFFWLQNQYFPGMLRSYVENGEFLTLEASISPEEIMESHQSELLRGESYSYQPPSLQFYPYLLMEVKYTPTGKGTREGMILWSMVDGEMVLDTQSWKKTHGFSDALQAKATPHDFIILNALAASQRGTLSFDYLKRALGLEEDQLNGMLSSVREKHLVVIRGNEVSLHFENPQFLVPPQTRIHQWLVTKPYVYAQRVKAKHTAHEIEAIASAAFGHNFIVRDTKVVYLPVYNIVVENPDGSTLNSFWNGTNGKRLHYKYAKHAY